MLKIMGFLLNFLALITFTAAVFQDLNFNTSSSIVVYWGQSTHSHNQRELSYYCSSHTIDIIIISFMSVFGKDYDYEGRDGYTLNIANQCSLSDEGDYTCPSIRKDIKKCQDMGKKVLLSLGGEQGKKQTYGFSDEQEGVDFASTLWNAFGEGNGLNRPFGDSVIDGFDIDTENEDETGYVSLIAELKKLSQNASKKLYFTAAPECTFVELNQTRLITEVDLDYVFVQFYNNECNLNNLEDFNYNIWSELIRSRGPSNTKIFIGLPSSKKSASKGFIKNPELIKKRIVELSSTQNWRESFGGLMFWDASKGFDYSDIDSEKSYIYKVWSRLNGDTIIESSGSASSFIPKSKVIPKTHDNDAINFFGEPSTMALIASILFLILLY